MTSVTDLSRTTLLGFRAFGSTFHHKFSVITSVFSSMMALNCCVCPLCIGNLGGGETNVTFFSGGKQKLEPETRLDPKRRFVVQCYSEIRTTSDDLRLRPVGVGEVHRGELLLPTYYLQAQKTPQWTHSSSKPDRAVLLSAPPANV